MSFLSRSWVKCTLFFSIHEVVFNILVFNVWLQKGEK